MKLLLIYTLIPLAISAAEPKLNKVSSTGYVSEDWSRDEICELSAHGVRITKVYGKTEVTHSIKFENSIDLMGMIKLAEAETLKTGEIIICDGPSTDVIAMYEDETESETEVKLYSTPGCGFKGQERQGPHSDALMELIGTYCPTTNRYESEKPLN